jgi:predicted nucleic acid-binding protein
MGGIRDERDTGHPGVLILNATPIIYICKTGLVGNLRTLRPAFRLLTTREVYEEVYVKGVGKVVSETGSLKELFDGNVVEVESPKQASQIDGRYRSSGIHPGEASVISLALELDGIAILDDKRATRVAKALGVGLSGTPGILIELVRRNAMSKIDARIALEKMIEEGWYCGVRVFSEIVNAIEEVDESDARMPDRGGD